MAWKENEVKFFNSQKEVDYNTLVPAMTDIFRGFRQARTGYRDFSVETQKEFADEERVFLQIRGLNLTISSIQILISLGVSIVKLNSEGKRKSALMKYNGKLQRNERIRKENEVIREWYNSLSEKEKEEVTEYEKKERELEEFTPTELDAYERTKSDYKPLKDAALQYNDEKLTECIEALADIRKDIILSEKTKEKKERYIDTEITDEGNKIRVTDKFWETLNKIDIIFQEVHKIFIQEGILSFGIKEEEGFSSYEEAEKEAIRRLGGD